MADCRRDSSLHFTEYADRDPSSLSNENASGGARAAENRGAFQAVFRVAAGRDGGYIT